MENNELIQNEEIIEATEEIAEQVKSYKGLKVAAGIGVGVIVGGILYKYAFKPMISKYKSKKETKHVYDDVSEEDIQDVEEVTNVEDENEDSEN